MNPSAIVRRSARMYGGNTAVWFEGRELSYAELHARACRGPLVFSAISDGSQTQH